MSKNNLLNEGTVRRFMKLANVDSLTDTFVEKINETTQVDESETIEEDIFAPNHYCVHHGGVQHEGVIKAGEAINHNYNEELGRVTHYDMKLEDGTILENVAAEDIQVTQATLEARHKGHKAKRDKEDLEEMGGGYAMGDRDDDDDMDEPAMDVEVDVEDEDDAPVGDAADNDLVKLATSILDAVQDAVNSVVPGLVSVDSDEEEDMMPADDMMDMDEPEEPMMEEGEETLEEETVEEAAHADDDDKKKMEETIEEVNVVEDEDLINEVAKRVTARLVKSLAARKNS
jgi:hypothetical protein